MVNIGGIVSVGGGASSGGAASSGITSINSQLGPAITIAGVNGINVSVPSTNVILIDGAGASGSTAGSVSVSPVFSYKASFTNITDATFAHNFGSTEVIVQIYDSSSPPLLIVPDKVSIVDSNNVRLRFNAPQTGHVTIHGPSGVSQICIDCSGTSSKFAANFTNLTSGIFNHNLNTLDVIVQVRDTGIAGIRPPAEIIPDLIVFDNVNNISLIFNKSQNGRVVII